jgi:protein-S-isoprenylcysteine O-methyltransferase Ste14
MSDPGPFIVVAVGLVLLGALISLLALLSPVRSLCRRSTGARIAVICILGFVSLTVGFGLWTRLNAQVAYVFGTFVMVDTFDPDRIPTATWPPETQENRPFVVRELWVRLLVPPAVRRPCYAREAWVCELADDVLPASSDRWNWTSYLQDVAVSCVPVLASTVLGWFFTGEHASAKREITSETRRAIIRWILQAALGLVGYGAILFLSAGSLSWAWGWALLAVLTAFMAAHPLILVPINPELLAEREKGVRDQGVKTWDKWIASLAAGMMVLSWIVAGLDVRFQWTAPMLLTYHVAGLLIVILGLALFLWAMASNAFFSEGVRIQEERGHAVVTGGPYRVVRHPGYVGAILAQLATPFLLGSLWAFIPSVALAALYTLRTYLEDRMLIDELPGYKEYARRTPYRLVPGVW